MHIEELSIEECFRNLVGKRTGRIACARQNQPYIVPFHFAFDGVKSIYAFSTLGQKIIWMRENPLVCVEVDDINEHSDWTSLIISGRYQELPEAPEFESERKRAYELLAQKAMWWEPAYVAGVHRTPWDPKPIYFRIMIETITGHRAVADNSGSKQESERADKSPSRSWFANLWKANVSRRI